VHVRKVATAVGLAAAVFVAFGSGTALASSVHLKGGKNAKPAFVDNGLTLSASGELSGLGNGDVLVTITATANPVATCQNPGSGEHVPPGRNPAPVTATGSVSIPEEAIQNGNTPFSVTTDAPVTPVAGAPDCSNSNWIEEILDMQFTSAVITVEQSEGTLVLTVTCSISPPSSDGAIPGSSVTCTSS
jgi:hypothetical protein